MEIVNYSDTHSYEEGTNNNNSAEILSDSNGGEEEIVTQPEQIREHKRMCMYVSKQQITDSQLDWKEKIDTTQRPSSTSMPGFDTSIEITKDSMPMDVIHIVFDNEMFRIIPEVTNSMHNNR
jgi:hypothetical protein